jgi:hypothetical protein
LKARLFFLFQTRRVSFKDPKSPVSTTCKSKVTAGHIKNLMWQPPADAKNLQREREKERALHGSSVQVRKRCFLAEEEASPQVMWLVREGCFLQPCRCPLSC